MYLKLSILFILIILGGKKITAQDSCSIPLRADEIYILSVEIEELVLKAKCPCDPRFKRKCYLYKIKIKDVFFLSDTSIYDNESLKNVCYMYSAEEGLDNKGVDQPIYCNNSFSKKYLAYSRSCLYNFSFLDKATFYHVGGYFAGGLFECLKNRRDPFLIHINKKEKEK